MIFKYSKRFRYAPSFNQIIVLIEIEGETKKMLLKTKQPLYRISYSLSSIGGYKRLSIEFRTMNDPNLQFFWSNTKFCSSFNEAKKNEFRIWQKFLKLYLFLFVHWRLSSVHIQKYYFLYFFAFKSRKYCTVTNN